MYRCQLCETVVGAGTRTHKIVVQTRPKEYAARDKSPARGGGPRGRFRAARSKNFDPGGEGHEIVRELTVCPDCATKYEPPARPEPVRTLEPEPVVEPETTAESEATESA